MIEVFTQHNGGKADALNNTIRDGGHRRAGDVPGRRLDAGPRRGGEVGRLLPRPRVVATASNVNIMPNGTLLGLVQRYEYLISYHMKKAHNIFNVEYIIGGIGSMFRRDVLDEVGMYDTNTMTEDIDLTMKIIAKNGNRRSGWPTPRRDHLHRGGAVLQALSVSGTDGSTVGCRPSSKLAAVLLDGAQALATG